MVLTANFPKVQVFHCCYIPSYLSWHHVCNIFLSQGPIGKAVLYSLTNILIASAFLCIFPFKKLQVVYQAPNLGCLKEMRSKNLLFLKSHYHLCWLFQSTSFSHTESLGLNFQYSFNIGGFLLHIFLKDFMLTFNFHNLWSTFIHLPLPFFPSGVLIAISRVFKEVSVHCSTSESNSSDWVAEHKEKILPASVFSSIFTGNVVLPSIWM